MLIQLYSVNLTLSDGWLVVAILLAFYVAIPWRILGLACNGLRLTANQQAIAVLAIGLICRLMPVT
ncbi:hypothetical protein PSEUDO8AS_90140 [Pseudomonas sp. 8AS]|nr:hypothetical protein PSEUDO8AS_90140 [Pseudomonas sp. 8AS]